MTVSTGQPSTHPAYSDVASRDASSPPRAHGQRRAAPDRRRRPVMIRPLITAGSLALVLCAGAWSGPASSNQAAPGPAVTSTVAGPVSVGVEPVAVSRPLTLPSPAPLSRPSSLSPSAGDILTCRDRRGRSSANSDTNSDGVSIDILFDQASRRDRSSSDRGGGSLVVGCGSDGQLVVLSCAGSGQDGRDNSDSTDRNSDRNSGRNSDRGKSRKSDRGSSDRGNSRGRANGADWNFGDRDSRDLDTRDLDSRDLQDLIDLSRRTGLDLGELIDLASDRGDNHSNNHGDNSDSRTGRDPGGPDGISVEGPLGRIAVGHNAADLWNLYRGTDRGDSARLIRSASDQNQSDQNRGARSPRAGVCQRVDR